MFRLLKLALRAVQVRGKELLQRAVALWGDSQKDLAAQRSAMQDALPKEESGRALALAVTVQLVQVAIQAPPGSTIFGYTNLVVRL